MKLSKLTDYAVVILTDMARRDGALLSASSVSAATALPEPTVSKILKLLVKGGVVSSVRGANGGYRLAGRPDSIRVGAVVTAMEGPIALTSCVDGGAADRCAREGVCGVRGRWTVVNDALRAALDGVTLADMLSRCPAADRERREA